MSASQFRTAQIQDGAITAAKSSTNMKTRTINFIMDAGGGVLTTGTKGYVIVDFDCTIQQWSVLIDATGGSIVVDIKRCTYANFATTTSMVGGSGNPPTTSSATKAQAAPSSWTSTSITAGDVLEFNITSLTGVSRVTISLKLQVS